MSSSGFIKDVYRAVLNGLAATVGTECAKKFDARVRFGRRLDLRTPSTLADLVNWLELNTDQTLVAQCSDKYAVREYVASKGLEDILVPLCGGPWTDVGQIDLESLPRAFVLKAAHGCEMNYICRDKDDINRLDLERKAGRWLKSDYPRACVEPHYKLIPHRLYAEKYIGSFDGIVDYKFHCFNGSPGFVLTCSEREKSLKLNLYDLDWNPLPGLQGAMRNEKEIPRPSCLQEMVEVAHKLSEDFPFVRVDLYEDDGRILFGELTFTPACGVFPYFTDDFLRDWGARLHIDEFK